MTLSTDNHRSDLRSGLYSLLTGCWLLLSLLAPVQAHGGPVSTEYTLKAALIFKLTRFVTWPAGRETRNDGKFGICLLGRDDFGATLDALQGRTVNGAPIVVDRFSQSDAIGDNCQVVIISDSKRAFIEPITRALSDRPILTIGDSRRFADQGGMIQFVRHDQKIGFIINLQQATVAGLKIAAPLLELATIVGHGSGGTKK